MSHVVRVHFAVSGGPATSIGGPAEPLGDNRVRLPRSIANAAKGDVYLVRRGADGLLWAEEKLESAGYCAIHVTLTRNSPLASVRNDVDAILARFAPHGVTGAGMFGNATLDIPPDTFLPAVRRLLDDGVRDGWWTYRAVSVTDAWRAISPPAPPPAPPR